ncbi:MAG TPA: ATP-binding protein, partial [Clostridia bacterium]|nr:ATP-binding protein [Clostridia bacterium]
KQAEQDLRESEGRYRALLESAPDAVVVFQNWRLVYLNAAALRLCGARALDEVWGKEIFHFLPAQDQEVARESGERLLEGLAVPPREIHVRRLDGGEVSVEAAGGRVEWLGQPAVQAILRDITEHKLFEQELQTAREQLLRVNASLEQTVRERTAELREAIEDLHRFSYAIIHDMRAPLRAMHSFATLMQGECASCELTQNRDLLQRIREAAERLDNLIQDALNYSRVLQERLPITPVDLSRLLRGMIESYPNLQPSAADITMIAPLPVVLGNEAALTQCFSNLLDNAVKFVAPGVRPRVRIWAEMLEPRPGSRPEEPQQQFIRIWIQDNGIGIAPQHQTHIFEIFHRLNKQYEGTGIGLAIVRKAVERMSGRVGLESEVGEGSRFWLELRPATLLLPAKPAAPDPSAPTKEDLSGGTVENHASWE